MSDSQHIAAAADFRSTPPSAALLSAEEREDLRFLAMEARRFMLGGDQYDASEYERRCKVVRGTAAIDRLLGAKP